MVACKVKNIALIIVNKCPFIVAILHLTPYENQQWRRSVEKMYRSKTVLTMSNKAHMTVFHC